MRYPQRFWPFALVIGTGWAVMIHGLSILLDRFKHGEWPRVGLDHVALWVVSGFAFGALLWWWQKRSGRELR